MTVLAATSWKSNADLILACVELGYLKETDYLIDPTWGRGLWWSKWKPILMAKSDLSMGVDFRQLPAEDAQFDAAAFDPPYTCVGGRKTTGIPDFFDRYGLTDAPKTPAALQEMNNAGLKELGRVVKPGGFILAKCTNYVSSSKLQLGVHKTLEFALSNGFECWDQLIHVGHARAQPKGRTRKDGKPVRQEHARANYSVLLVLKAPK